jgi:hypothetical protein
MSTFVRVSERTRFGWHQNDKQRQPGQHFACNNFHHTFTLRKISQQGSQGSSQLITSSHPPCRSSILSQNTVHAECGRIVLCAILICTHASKTEDGRRSSLFPSFGASAPAASTGGGGGLSRALGASTSAAASPRSCSQSSAPASSTTAGRCTDPARPRARSPPHPRPSPPARSPQARSPRASAAGRCSRRPRRSR